MRSDRDGRSNGLPYSDAYSDDVYNRMAAPCRKAAASPMTPDAREVSDRPSRYVGQGRRLRPNGRARSHRTHSDQQGSDPRLTLRLGFSQNGKPVAVKPARVAESRAGISSPSFAIVGAALFNKKLTVPY